MVFIKTHLELQKERKIVFAKISQLKRSDAFLALKSKVQKCFDALVIMSKNAKFSDLKNGHLILKLLDII